MKDLLSHETVDENLRFLIVEVLKQVERTRAYFNKPTQRLFDSLLARDDYIDNLKSLIQRKVLRYAVDADSGHNKAHVHLLNSVDVATINLERIADFCVNVVDQLGYIQNPKVLEKVDFTPFFEQVTGGLSLIEHALFDRDIQEATAICRAEGQLDTLYADVFRQMLEELNDGKDAQSLVTIIFIAHYFERMGDSLLNIGEAVISACLGEPTKIGQFLALEDSLERADLPKSPDDVRLKAYLGTRSGHRIARVSAGQDGDGSRMVIFKEGRAEKLREEVESIQRWEEISEGLAPKIYSFHERGDAGAILFEYLPGKTFEAILVEGDNREVDLVTTRITETIGDVWERSKKRKKVRAKFLAQLEQRLDDVFTIHPEYRDEGMRIGDVDVLSLEQLIETTRRFDELLQAPFSVFVHGDFNVDNIIFDPMQNRVRFIDLHRSRQTDYVQDVATFLVSNFRLQVFKAPVRRRIARAVGRFYEFSRRFAEKNDDPTFSARLGLGLARSFLTSTRFVLDPKLSRSMMLKSRYLLERLAATDPKRLDQFHLPGDIFFG
jgi:phosphate uptake regulator